MSLAILRPHYLAFRNRFRFRARNPHGIKRELLLFFITAVIVSAIFLSFSFLFRGLAREPIFLQLVPAKLIELAFFYFFLLLVISSTVSAMGNIYSSEIMNILLAAPLSRARIFWAKFLETFLETTIMFFLFCSPAVLAYSRELAVQPGFLLTAIFVSLLFLAIPVAIGISFSTIFAGCLAFLWQRGTILLLAGAGVFIWALNEIADELATLQTSRKRHGALARLVGLYQNPNSSWLPSRWATDLINSQLTAGNRFPTESLLLLASTAVASISIAYLVFDILVLRVRSSASVHRLSSRPGSTLNVRLDLLRKLFEFITRPLEQQTRAVILKDLSSLVRDRAQALQLLLFLGVSALYITIYGFMSAAMSATFITQQLWSAFLSSLNILLVGFILTTVMTRLVYPSVSLEGKAFWILQVAPIQIQTLVRAKLLCWLPVTIFFAVTLTLSGAVAVGTGYEAYPMLILLAASLAVSCTGLAIGVGAVFASFDWDSPSQLSIGLGTLVLLLGNLSLVVIVSAPASAILFLAFVPKLRDLIGEQVAFYLMTGLLMALLLGAIAITKFATNRGARALEYRKRG